MPFRAGEILNYRLEWAPFSNAASVQTAVVERRDLFGWQTWHFRASVHSQPPLRNLFEVDDQFDSYTDAASLESHQYEMYLDEMGKKQDAVLHLIAIGQSRRGNVAPMIVQPGTRDPLGAFYALRATDWKRTPELRVPLYDGSDLYEMRAHLEVPVETVAITIGNYQATRIAIHLFMRGKEVPQTNFSVWLAHDACADAGSCGGGDALWKFSRGIDDGAEVRKSRSFSGQTACDKTNRTVSSTNSA